MVEIPAFVGIAPCLQPRFPVMFARRFGPGGIIGRDHKVAVGAERRGEKHSVILREHRYFSRFLRLTLSLATVLRSEEHTSELQSLMRISYAVFCLKKKIILQY